MRLFDNSCPLPGEERSFSSPRSLAAKCSAILILLVLVPLLIAALFFNKRQEGILYAEKVRAGKVLLENLAVHAVVPFLGDDRLSLNSMVKEAKQVDGFLYAAILDGKKTPVAQTDPPKIDIPFRELEKTAQSEAEKDVASLLYTLPSGIRVLNLVKPMTFMNKTLGYAHVGLSLEVIDRQVRKETPFPGGYVLFIALFGTALAVGFSVFFFRRFGQIPLRPMEEMVFPKNPDSAADPGEEYSGSPKIVRDHVTVLFAGIKGFRRYAERKELKEVLRDLNGYLAVVTETIVDHGGYIDKFVGDAVIGVFGHNPLQPDHTLRATRSAVAIQRALKNASTDGNQLLSKVGIGISSGVVLSGHIGSDEKKELSYIGESFKAAYTLNVMAGPGEIVISKEVYQSLAGLVSAEPLPPREMIQRTGPWESFRLHGIGEGKGGC